MLCSVCREDLDSTNFNSETYLQSKFTVIRLYAFPVLDWTKRERPIKGV